MSAENYAAPDKESNTQRCLWRYWISETCLQARDPTETTEAVAIKRICADCVVRPGIWQAGADATSNPGGRTILGVKARNPDHRLVKIETTSMPRPVNTLSIAVSQCQTRSGASNVR